MDSWSSSVGERVGNADLEAAFIELCEHSLFESFADEVVPMMSVGSEFRVRRALDLVQRVPTAAKAKRVEGA